MSDDKTDSGPDEDDKPDLAAVRRRQAEGTAADLARMGIDPRSLGLSTPGEAPSGATTSAPEAEPGSTGGDDAQVVPLRPELDVPQPEAPLLQPGGPTAPERPSAAPDAPKRAPGAVEQLLSRTAHSARPPRQGGRFLKAVTKGMTTADAAESVLADREVVDAVRQRQSDRRVVAFVSGKGGVGCTTAAVGVGTCFAAMREDRSAVVDVQQGTTGLSGVLGSERSVDLLGAASLDVDTPIPNAPSGLGLVDGVEWDLTPSRRDLAGALERLGVDHAFALLDAGASAGEAAHAALARADQIIAVTGAGGLGLAALQTALDRIREVNPAAADRVVHVVVCHHEETYRTVHREIVSRLGRQPAAVVVVPPDPYLAQGHAYDPAHVTADTREAYVRLAAAVALGATR